MQNSISITQDSHYATERLHFPTKTTPSKSLRYCRPKRFGPQIALRGHSGKSIPSWSQYVHPEGLRYYYNSSLHVVTDANMQNDRIYGLVVLALRHLLAWLQTQVDFKRGDSQEIVLELNEDEDRCQYYMVDHELQTILYADEANTEDLDIRNMVSTSQLNLELQRQYWVYLEYFPMHKELNPSARLQLIGMLHHSTIDTLSSNNSTSVLSSSQSKNYLDIIQNFTAPAVATSDAYRLSSYNAKCLLSSPGAPESRGYETCIIARVMEDFFRGRVIHFYGEAEGARLARREYIDEGDEADPKSFWFKPVSWLLFGQPSRKLQLIEALGVNSIFYKDSWKEFNASHVSEWKRTTTMALTLMIVDILSITYLHESQGKHQIISNIAFQIGWHAGAMSAISCFGSLILGLTAISVHEPYCSSHAGDAASYFKNAYNEVYGYQPLAIVLGLPYVMLLWALLGTGVTFMSLALRNEHIWSMTILGSVVLLMVGLIIWAVRALHSGEREEEGVFSSVCSTVVAIRNNVFCRGDASLKAMDLV
ncbi:hypothetical protein M422DRAFT_55002 [Sphaerobolus stellatus SS14]|uniref:Uncharacterized protein n=1 Tax=Sphaerobolus stellatus (strain SS14) TaxID=990650 RepID=A0A0C9UQ77_SPHS4|nr:hypothetical protein M422DRAFT_55002 [Sphaerobolus stellatus SS14]